MNKQFSKTLAILILLSLAAVSVRLRAGPAEDEAAANGQKRLSLLDGGKYEESWKQSASMFRDQVTEDAWVAALKRSREPMGDVVTRVAKRVDFTQALRGAPNGDYVIIHFATEFKNKQGVVERLTLVKEEGEWKMAAYAIH